MGVRVLPVQHDVGGADLARAAVDAVELVRRLDAVHQGAVLPQVWVHGHHLPMREGTDPPLSPTQGGCFCAQAACPSCLSSHARPGCPTQTQAAGLPPGSSREAVGVGRGGRVRR